jgi:hypothetical protein
MTNDISSSPIRSIYVPPYGLQGQNFSCHILWEPSYNLKVVRIQTDEAVTVENIYNSSEEFIALKDNGRTVETSKVMENGYIGFVLKSNRMIENFKIANIDIDIVLFKDGKNVEKRKQYALKLFRPDLKLLSVPKLMKVEFSKNMLNPTYKDRIKITNQGVGAALLLILPGNNSNIKFTNLFGEETAQFITNLRNALNHLKVEYAEHAELLGMLIDLFSLVKKLANGEYNNVEEFEGLSKQVSKQMQKMEKNDPEFINDVSDAISDVFHSVFSVNKEFQSWVNSIESMRSQRITLLNPLSAIEIQNKTTKLTLKFLYLDALGNFYPEIETEEIVLETSESDIMKIPIFELITLEGE